MPIFATEKLEIYYSDVVVEKLLIDDKCQLDEFEEKISTNKKYLTQLGTIYGYIELSNQGESLPDTLFKNITPRGDAVKEYEFKSKNLRVYAIKIPNGKLLILGGTKNRQRKDIKKFRSIKKQYIDYLNSKEDGTE